MEQRAHLLPPHIITCKRLLVTCAIAPKMLSNYGASLIRFHQFCDDMHIPEELHMPSPEWLLSAFLMSRGAGSVGKGAMTAWLQGLHLWHTINHAPWFGGAHLQRALQGSSNASLASSSNPKRKLASLAHLQALLCGLRLTNTFDVAVFAIACVAFWGQCRLAELTVDSAFDPMKHASHSAWLRDGISSSNIKHGGFRAPKTKTLPKGEDIL